MGSKASPGASTASSARGSTKGGKPSHDDSQRRSRWNWVPLCPKREGRRVVLPRVPDPPVRSGERHLREADAGGADRKVLLACFHPLPRRTVWEIAFARCSDRFEPSQSAFVSDSVVSRCRGPPDRRQASLPARRGEGVLPYGPEGLNNRGGKRGSPSASAGSTGAEQGATPRDPQGAPKYSMPFQDMSRKQESSGTDPVHEDTTQERGAKSEEGARTSDCSEMSGSSPRRLWRTTPICSTRGDRKRRYSIGKRNVAGPPSEVHEFARDTIVVPIPQVQLTRKCFGNDGAFDHMWHVRIFRNELQLAKVNADAELSEDEVRSRRWIMRVRQMLVCMACVCPRDAERIAGRAPSRHCEGRQGLVEFQTKSDFILLHTGQC